MSQAKKIKPLTPEELAEAHKQIMEQEKQGIKSKEQQDLLDAHFKAVGKKPRK